MNLQQKYKERVVGIVLKKHQQQLPKLHEVGSTTANAVAMLIDEIGAMLPDVEAKQQKIKMLQKDLLSYGEKMRALVSLISAIDGYAADETFALEGVVFAAEVGKRCLMRTVSDPHLAIKLLNKAEKGIAWKIITVPLGKIDLFLNPSEKDRILKIDRGERPLTITACAAERNRKAA
jgi:hypothetical protein